MKIKILCLGRLNKDEENELCKRYESRLKSLKNSGITNFQTNNSGYLTTHYWSSSIMTNYVGALAQSMAPTGIYADVHSTSHTM